MCARAKVFIVHHPLTFLLALGFDPFFNTCFLAPVCSDTLFALEYLSFSILVRVSLDTLLFDFASSVLFLRFSLRGDGLSWAILAKGCLNKIFARDTLHTWKLKMWTRNTVFLCAPFFWLVPFFCHTCSWHVFCFLCSFAIVEIVGVLRPTQFYHTSIETPSTTPVHLHLHHKPHHDTLMQYCRCLVQVLSIVFHPHPLMVGDGDDDDSEGWLGCWSRWLVGLMMIRRIGNKGWATFAAGFRRTACQKTKSKEKR